MCHIAGGWSSAVLLRFDHGTYGDIVKDPVVTNEVCCPPFCGAILLLRSTSPKKPSISFKDFKKHMFEDIVFLWQNVASPFRQSLMATSLQNSFT